MSDASWAGYRYTESFSQSFARACEREYKSSKLSHDLVLQMPVLSTTHTHTHPAQTDGSCAHPNEDWPHQDICLSLCQVFSYKE